MGAFGRYSPLGVHMGLHICYDKPSVHKKCVFACRPSCPEAILSAVFFNTQLYLKMSVCRRPVEIIIRRQYCIYARFC